MTHHNETLKNDSEGFAALQRSFNIQQKHAKDASSDSVSAKLLVVDQERAFVLLLVEEMKVVTAALDELVHAVRTELEIETDFDEFRAQTIGMQTEMEALLAELLASAAKFREKEFPNEATKD